MGDKGLKKMGELVVKKSLQRERVEPHAPVSELEKTCRGRTREPHQPKLQAQSELSLHRSANA